MHGTSPPESQRNLSRGLILLLATACGAMVANLYYAQTLIDTIGPEIGLSPGVAGAITTLTQLGYGAGLALFVPLGDLFENKRLALLSTAGAILGCLGIAASNGPVSFLAASLITGICATGAQVVLPLASHLAVKERQGRVIGTIMSGLLFGIMLARPVASFLADAISWRAVFLLSAGLMAAIGIALWFVCPTRKPETKLGYGAILGSVWGQLRRHRALRLRAFYQAMLFAAFNLFWTAAPLELLRNFDFTQQQVAWFALAGAGGALAAPLAGSLADRGLMWWTSFGALLMLTLSFIGADVAVAATSVAAFVIAAILIDTGVQLNQITGQKIIFALSSDARARVNAAYMTVMFVVGASGSLIGSATFEHGGWTLSALTGAAIGGIALVIFLLFDRGASDPD
ncbi:MFS transporter [Stakelama saccharophila]|uniref:MFS transporter n=1 Tax=Stakelama saccharophila TaxID=3075605 RepID=A0ABZ0BDL2_9SPHN|nr:MFS transporter [Stakelama sp. W311]WNO54998.1 MFS transporter [Stakelama sp. W311]